MLSASAARTVGVYLEVLGTYLDVYFRGLGQNRDSRGRCVDASARLGLGHALHAVDAAFKLEHTEGRRPVDAEDDFLEAADARFAHRDYLRLPALAFREARVHAEKVRGEERGLVSARAAADFYNDAFFVVHILREKQNTNLALELRHASLKLGKLVLRKLAHLLVVALRHLLRLGDAVKHLLVLGECVDYRRQLDVFFAELLHLVRVVDDFGVGHLLFEFPVAGLNFF